MTRNDLQPRRPASLRSGSKVAVIAPGSAIVDRDALRAGLARLEALGLVPVAGRHLDARHGDLAGTDAQRAADLAWALTAADIDAVWAARGGWGTARALERLGRIRLPPRPRWVVGFSDLTPLLNRLAGRGWITLHGPVVCDLAQPGRFVARDLSGWLFGDRRETELEVRISGRLRAGHARGRLAGGCLSLLAAVTGTSLAPDLRGTILLLEEVGEAPYRVDRMLWQLRAGGMLAGVRALAFGQMTRCTVAAGRRSRSVRTVLREHADALQVPALAGLPIGHGRRTRAVPIGADAELDGGRGRLIVRAPAAVG